jgi:hypothetical protein
MSNAPLSTTPESVAHADALLKALDRCFVSGFSRLGNEHRQTLDSVARVFTGSPLAEPVAAAAAALGRGEVTEDHLVMLACARESLAGARHDALAAQACAALGDSVALVDVDAGAAAPGPAAELPKEALTYMSSSRQWLVEVALAGLGQLEVPTVVPFAATLEAMQAVPALFGLSALLTGFMDELGDNLPTAAMAAVPARRWSDLFSRALVGAWKAKPAPASETISGTLHVLGVDIRHHDHIISVAAYGLLARKDASASAGPRMVRATLSAWKVDAIAGDEIWTALLSVPGGRELLRALAESKAINLDGATLSAGGELALTGKLALGSAFDPMDTALGALAPGAKLAVPTPPPLDRHPAYLAIPVVIDQAEYSDGKQTQSVAVAGAPVPLAWARVSPLAGMDPAELRRYKQLFGLLRYDGGSWSVQPLLAQSGKKQLGPAAGIARGLKLKRSATALGTLQERASKLLRAK